MKSGVKTISGSIRFSISFDDAGGALSEPVELVNWLKTDSSRNMVQSFDTFFASGSSADIVFTETMPAGRVVLLVSSISSAVSQVRVDGVGVTAYTSYNFGAGYIRAFEYTFPAAGDYEIAINPTGTTGNVFYSAFTVPSDATLTIANAAPVTPTDYVLAQTQSVNTAQTYVPDGAAVTEVIATGDIQSNELTWLGKWDAPATNILADADFIGTGGAMFVSVTL